MPKLARFSAWTLVAGLAFVTLAPIDLRPVSAAPPNLERALAYALLGFLMALAYPRHRLLAFSSGIALAAGLEIGQVFTASRHGRVADFAVKAIALGLGVLGAHVLMTIHACIGRGQLVTGR